MAPYCLVCAFGYHSLVTALTRCGLPLPVYFLADEKHSRCLTDKVYLPTIVSGRVIWQLGYTADAKLQDREKQLNLFDVHLKTTTYEQAKTMAPGWDIYALAAEWKAWASQQKDWPPKHPDAAFLGFCKKRGPLARMP